MSVKKRWKTATEIHALVSAKFGDRGAMVWVERGIVQADLVHMTPSDRDDCMRLLLDLSDDMTVSGHSPEPIA